MSPIPRRSFLKYTSLALAGTALLPKSILAAPARPLMLGIQLYTVRDDMKVDPKGTLTRLAAMGYRHVEHANYVNRMFYGYDAASFRTLLGSLGLTMPSGHTVMNAGHWDATKNDFTDQWKWTIEDAATVGQQYVISPWLDEGLRGDYDGLRRFLDVFNKSGELCRKSGLQFGYHNHDFEFSTQLNGKVLYDIILAGTDPSLVAQQLDIGNMYGGGAKPQDVLRQYPGRFELMHVKDVIKATGKGEMNDPYESTILGEGLLGTRDILTLARSYGTTTQFIIEQESYQGRMPLDDSAKDLQVMHDWSF
jgi:sugar phosphate isomerase/epimerase